MLLRAYCAALSLALTATVATAQRSPEQILGYQVPWRLGFVPSVPQVDALFTAKQDVMSFGSGVYPALGLPLNASGGLVGYSGALGTPTSGTLTNATGLPATGLTGTLQAAQFPALTGDVTSSAGSLATTIGAGAVTASKMAAGAAAGNLGYTPAKVINPADPAYGLSTSGTALANAAALRATATAACASGDHARIEVSAGSYNVDTSAGTVLPINCVGVSFAGAGGASTVFFLSGNRDFLVYSPASGQAYGGFASVSGFRVYRADSPTAGRGILFDHVSDVVVNDVEITGMYINAECNACLNVAINSSFLDGFETQPGSAMLKIHHTTASATAGAASLGAMTIPYSGLTGTIYYGQVVSDHTTGGSVPFGAIVTAWTSTTITINLPLTGPVNASDAIEMRDVNASAVQIGGGSIINSGRASSPYTYDYATLIQDCDGCWLTDIHTSWAKHSSLYIQPEYSDDQIDNILTTSNTYFDASGANCIEFQPYGGVTGSVSGAVAAGATSVTLASAPTTDVTGYSVLANGVASGVTVASVSGATITLSNGANSLGLLDGQDITFYKAFTGLVAANNLYGFCQGQLSGSGIVYNDPAVIGDKVSLNILNMGKSAVVVNAGGYLDINASIRNNNITNVATNSTILVQGNAKNIMLSGQLNLATHAPAYGIEQRGQALNVTIGQMQVASGAVATLDEINNGINTGPTSAGGLQSFSGHNNVTTIRSLVGQSWANIDGGILVTGFSNLQGAAFIGSSLSNYVSMGGSGAGGPPFIRPEGSDTNIDLKIRSKGIGSVYAAPGADSVAGFKVMNAALGATPFAVDTSGLGTVVTGYSTVTGNATVGGTLGVTGATTLAAVSMTSRTLTSLAESTTGPTIASGFCTAPLIGARTNGTLAFQLTIGTGCAGGGGTLTMPLATNGWKCNFSNVTNSTQANANKPDQTAYTATTVGVQNYSRTTGAVTNWTAGDVIIADCHGF